MNERYPRMNTTTSLDRSPMGRPTRPTLMVGPSSCLTISEIGEKEAVEWDKIVVARGGSLC